MTTEDTDILQRKHFSSPPQKFYLHVSLFLDSCTTRKYPCVLLKLIPSQRLQASLISPGALLQLCPRPPASLLTARARSLSLSLTLLLMPSIGLCTHCSFPTLTKRTQTKLSSQPLNLFSHPPLATESLGKVVHTYRLHFSPSPHSLCPSSSLSEVSAQPPSRLFSASDLPDLLVEISFASENAAVPGWLSPSLVDTQSLSGCSSSAFLLM